MAKLSPIKLRHERLRKKISGTPERPRLSVHFSGQHIYAQVIDDDAGRTLAAVNTTEKDFGGDKSAVWTRTRGGETLSERQTKQVIQP